MSPKNNDFIIRKAVRDDTAAMADLIRELAEFEKEPDAVTVSLEAFREAGFGTAPVWTAFVAEDMLSGKIVGMALYYIRYSTWKGKMYYLEDIIINRQFRKQGIGKRLMDALINKAKEEGMAGVTWQVLDWNDEAIAFYKKLSGVTFDEHWVNVKLLL